MIYTFGDEMRLTAMIYQVCDLDKQKPHPVRMRFLLVDHQGLEPWTDRLYSSRCKCASLTRCYAPRLAMPSHRGAICARLTCASTDSLAFDYVAYGSNRSLQAQDLIFYKQKRDNREGYLSFVGGPSRTRTLDRPVMSR